MVEKKICVLMLLMLVLLVHSCSELKSQEGIKNTEYAKALVINELMAANCTGLLAENGKPEDWIEIKNISFDTINLEGYGIEIIPAVKDSLLLHGQEDLEAGDTVESFDKKDVKKFVWHFPSIEIAGGECLLVFATKKEKTKHNKELAAKLKLPKHGGIVRLFAPDGTILSEVEWDELESDQALQRQESGEYVKTIGRVRDLIIRLKVSRNRVLVLIHNDAVPYLSGNL